MKNPLAKCGNCLAFAENEKNPAQGLCKKHPPMALVIPTNVAVPGRPNYQAASSYPANSAEEWCLEFTPNEFAMKELREQQNNGKQETGIIQ